MSKSKPAKIKKAKQGARKRQPTDGGLADDALEQVVGGVDVAGMPAGGQIVAAPYPEGGAAQVIEALKNPETMVLSQGVAIPILGERARYPEDHRQRVHDREGGQTLVTRMSGRV